MAEHDVVQIKLWFQANKLTMNLDKTKCLHFVSFIIGLSKLESLDVRDGDIPRTECMKYLGVIIDFHLKWYKHIQSAIRKVKEMNN